MNPYQTYSELLIACVNGPITEIVDLFNSSLNKTSPSIIEQALMSGAKEVRIFHNGTSKFYRKGDLLPHQSYAVQYLTKEVPLDFSLAYIDRAERDTTKEDRILFWEPKSNPGAVAFMGRFADGMRHTIWCLSRESLREWISFGIYACPEYPGCYLDFYANKQNFLRRLMASKDEGGWDFAEEGSLQSFENPDYYKRKLIKNRLNRAIITEYMSKIGYNISIDDFWETTKPAHLIWQQRVI